MAMSKRRFQFLDQLMGMYQKQRLPVHYAALAKAIGVSKWTAYDMLKEIEKSGYVTRSYTVNPNETGRSQVVFTPTEKAKELFKQFRSHDGIGKKREEIAQHLRMLMKKSMKHDTVQDLLKKMIDEIPIKKTNLEFCGYIVSNFMAYLNKIGGKTEALTATMIQKSNNYYANLLMFAGTVLGTVIQTMSEEISTEISSLVREYVEKIGQLSNSEQAFLLDFVKEGLI